MISGPWDLGEGLWVQSWAGRVGKAGSGDLGGPVQLRCSVPGWCTNHGAGSMQTSEERGWGIPLADSCVEGPFT